MTGPQAEIAELFLNSSKVDIAAILKRYHMDFRICGYEDTMKTLEALL